MIEEKEIDFSPDKSRAFSPRSPLPNRHSDLPTAIHREPSPDESCASIASEISS